MTDFRTIALALQPYISDTYDLLNATDKVMEALKPQVRSTLSHDELVNRARLNDTIMGFMAEKKKFNAIKELRALTNCGLKEAKEAVEDYRIAEEAAWRAVTPGSSY